MRHEMLFQVDDGLAEKALLDSSPLAPLTLRH
ncbi:hypothetical protein YQE_01393, partial [Dendroctonus ponderosae]